MYPFLQALWPGGLAWLTDRISTITVTLPGDSAARRVHLEASLSEGHGTGRADPVVRLVLPGAQPVLQSIVRYKNRRDRMAGFLDLSMLQQALERRGYYAFAQHIDGPADPDQPEAPPPLRPVGPFQPGERVRVRETPQRGTVMTLCRDRGCLVRFDLVGRQRKAQAHQDYVPQAGLEPLGDGRSRLAAFRVLLEQGVGRLSLRDADLYARQLGIVPPEVPPLSDDEEPPLRYVLGDLWRALRGAPPAGFTVADIDGFFERYAEALAQRIERAQPPQRAENQVPPPAPLLPDVPDPASKVVASAREQAPCGCRHAPRDDEEPAPAAPEPPALPPPQEVRLADAQDGPSSPVKAKTPCCAACAKGLPCEGAAHPSSPTRETGTPEEPLFDLVARGKVARLAPKVRAALDEARRAFAAAGFALEGKGPIRVVIAGGGDRSKFVAQDRTLFIGILHAERIDQDRRHAVYHELAHWYHWRHVGEDNVAVKDQYARVRHEKPVGGSVSDRAMDEYKALRQERLGRVQSVGDLSGQLERERVALERYQAAIDGRMEDERYRNLRSRWMPTEYARQNHREWFAELLTTRVLFPASLDEEVKAWLAQVAQPLQDLGDNDLGLFAVTPERCLDGYCPLAEVFYAEGHWLLLATAARADRAGQRYSVAQGELLVYQSGAGGWLKEDLGPAAQALLADLAVEERRLQKPDRVIYRLRRPVPAGEVYLLQRRFALTRGLASDAERTAVEAGLRLAVLPPGAKVEVTQRWMAGGIEVRRDYAAGTFVGLKGHLALVTIGKKRYGYQFGDVKPV